ncbi:MAG: dTDP-4-amino-4,6-dideoxygalactose transaminase [Candidatus Humimicrobiaceae bacterium]
MAEENTKIPFNIPTVTGNEQKFISDAISKRKISGDGEYTKKCCQLMEKRYDVEKILLTTSCSTALDMSAILTEINAGDEVILPSYTFTSTANSFKLRGANLKFIDIREDTLNIDENEIEKAINNKTKAIVVVHYAGVSCEMKKIKEIANKNNIFIIEDAAQCVESKYNGKHLGTIGDIGCFSFHETKNLTCGEGGTILINNSKFIERAEILWEKGTNRTKFYKGEVDKYTWVDVGSSFLPSEILAAFLYSQLENVEVITNKRRGCWNYYFDNLEKLEAEGFLKRPTIPYNCEHNGHLFYIILENQDIRDNLIDFLKSEGILAVFHYIPAYSGLSGHQFRNYPDSKSGNIRTLIR